MKAYYALFLAATSLLGGQLGGAADAEAAWKIEKLSLAPVSEGVRSLTASVLHVGESRSFEISDQVTLETIRDTFVWGDKLVLLGSAERASVVEIFDLTRQVKADRFVCYQPRRIGDYWIAYKEFFFSEAQGPGVPTEVLLVYDLAKTPQENRLKRDPGQKFPPPVGESSDNTVEVGVPVYPELNARQRSYQIVRETERAGRYIDARTITLLPSRKLVFSCAEMQPGMGWIGALQYLVVVDLSQGLARARSQVVHFTKQGEHGTTIERIEEEAPNAVRLVFPAGEYPVNDLLVSLPAF